jgi:hypothetical protein
VSHEYNKNPAAVDALNPEQYHVTQEKRDRASILRRVLGQ